MKSTYWSAVLAPYRVLADTVRMVLRGAPADGPRWADPAFCTEGGALDWRPLPNGTIINDYETLFEIHYTANPPVLVDRNGTPWLAFVTEDGDDCAVTAECPEEGIPARTNFDGLIERAPLRLVFNGFNRDDQWPGLAGGETMK